MILKYEEKVAKEWEYGKSSTPGLDTADNCKFHISDPDTMHYLACWSTKSNTYLYKKKTTLICSCFFFFFTPPGGLFCGL